MINLFRLESLNELPKAKCNLLSHSDKLVLNPEGSGNELRLTMCRLPLFFLRNDSIVIQNTKKAMRNLHFEFSTWIA